MRAGDFDYRLFQGGISGGAPNNWFLRSTFIAPPIPPIEPPVTPPVTPEIPGDLLPPAPPPEVLPPGGQFPIIGPELATYGAVQPIARQLGLATLGTLNQRVGDTLTLAQTGAGATGWGRSDWGRLFGQQINELYHAFADPSARGSLGGLQAGVDLWRGNLWPGHRDAAGVYFVYGQARAQVSGLVTNPAATAYMITQTGTINLEAYSGGAYWTHYGPSGWYIDAVLQGTAYRGSAATQRASLPTTGFGLIGSLEAGYPIRLPLGPGFALEPQAQIIWQQVKFNDADDGLGPVGLGTTASWVARLGLRGQWTLEDGNAIRWQPYVAINVWRRTGTQDATAFGVDSALLRESTTRTDLLGGVTARLSDQFSLYAQGGYQLVIDADESGARGGVQGLVGLRYTW